MATFPSFVARSLAGGAFIVLLALEATTAQAQVAPKPAPAVPATPNNVVYYVDGRPTTEAGLKALDPSTIASVNVIKDAAQKKTLGQEASDGVALVTTTSGATSPEVQAFNKRFPTKAATSAQNAGVAAAQAYVAQHYPAAKVESVTVVPGKTDRYNATFTNNGQRLQLLFDGQGHPVEQ